MQVAAPVSRTVESMSPSGAKLAPQVPAEVMTWKVHGRTIQQHVDRSIRFRLEGTGPASARALVADSKLAAELVQTKPGQQLVGVLRSMLGTADAYVGRENLNTITLVPDEQAVSGIDVMNDFEWLAKHGVSFDSELQDFTKQWQDKHPTAPALSRAEAVDKWMKQETYGAAKHVAFSAAWNSGGNIVVMPDYSRRLLSMVDAYEMRAKDWERKSTKPYPRVDRNRNTVETVLHEIQHSLTPRGGKPSPEHTRVFEESTAEIVARRNTAHEIRDARLDLGHGTRVQPDAPNGPVTWRPWNRKHLPAADAASTKTAGGRYHRGPKFISDLLNLAGIDRRFNTGQAAAELLLQGERSQRAPRRVADAILAHRGMDPLLAPQLADLIRQGAVAKATIGDVTRWLAMHAATV